MHIFSQNVKPQSLKCANSTSLVNSFISQFGMYSQETSVEIFQFFSDLKKRTTIKCRMTPAILITTYILDENYIPNYLMNNITHSFIRIIPRARKHQMKLNIQYNCFLTVS